MRQNKRFYVLLAVFTLVLGIRMVLSRSKEEA
jgi:hypothetical protein